jgi:E3 ubiquitin-protein ligase SIAH1
MFQTDANINELLNTLECPVCLDTADDPPIYQCPEGHLLCERCNQRLNDCPQCGHALMNSRNRTAEDLAVKLQVNIIIVFLNN